MQYGIYPNISSPISTIEHPVDEEPAIKRIHTTRGREENAPRASDYNSGVSTPMPRQPVYEYLLYNAKLSSRNDLKIHPSALDSGLQVEAMPQESYRNSPKVIRKHLIQVPAVST